MKLVIAGGSGFIGRPLCRALFNDGGHEVYVLSRQDSRTEVPYARVIPWDGRNVGSWQDAVEGAAAVINLSGAGVADGRWTEKRKQELRDSRMYATRALVAAMAAAKKRPEVFISASAVGFYGDRGAESLDESSYAGTDFLAQLCVDWEEEARRAPDCVRTVLLRVGIVLGQGGGALYKMLLPFRCGLGGPIGDGRQWMSWISREDVVGLIVHALTGDARGPLNATAPEPITNADFSAALGKALKRPAKLRMPASVVKALFGEMGGMLLSGQRVMPRLALESGYAFKHPRLDEALASALR